MRFAAGTRTACHAHAGAVVCHKILMTPLRSPDDVADPVDDAGNELAEGAVSNYTRHPLPDNETPFDEVGPASGEGYYGARALLGSRRRVPQVKHTSLFVTLAIALAVLLAIVGGGAARFGALTSAPPRPSAALTAPRRDLAQGHPPHQVAVAPLRVLPAYTETLRNLGSLAPTLFCFVLFRAGTYEQELVAMQRQEHIGIFECDKYSLYSNASSHLMPTFHARDLHINLACEVGGSFHTVLNTNVFVHLWRMVIAEGHWEAYDWTVKLDPDTVFIAARLRGALVAHMDGIKGVFLANCGGGLHGPLEVFSRRAVSTLQNGLEHCSAPKSEARGNWGEDMFMVTCLANLLDVSKDQDGTLLCEHNCDCIGDWQSCGSGHAAFHPFKSPSAYRRCLANALAARIRWAPHPDLCLDVEKEHDKEIQLWECGAELDSRMQFSVTPHGSGPIRWTVHPSKCIALVPKQGYTGIEFGVELQDCQVGVVTQNFKVPWSIDGNIGPIRWAHQPSKCLNVREYGSAVANGVRFQLLDCEEYNPHMQFMVGTR